MNLSSAPSVSRIPSGIAQLGSGAFYNIQDASRGFGFNQQVFYRGEGVGDDSCFLSFAFCTVDLKFEKEFEVFGGQQFALVLDVFNAFDSKNFGGYNGFIPPTGETNPNFGQPSNLVTRPRSIQVGFRYSF